MSKQALHVITCDNCRAKKELGTLQSYSEWFVNVSINNLNRDLCKDCAKSFKFIPEVLL